VPLCNCFFIEVLQFKGVPTVYDEGDPDDVAAVVEWLDEQRTSATIEKVTEEILQYLIEAKEYLAVFFTGPCNERAKTDQECKRVRNKMQFIRIFYIEKDIRIFPRFLGSWKRSTMSWTPTGSAWSPRTR
jgi:hypothetical protein